MASMEFKNNSKSTVPDAPLAAGATTLNVAAGEGANFPSTFPFLLTIWHRGAYPNPGDDSGMEIVRCTGRTTDTLTIVRAQEGTADVEHTVGERVAMLITAGHFDNSSYGIVTKLDTIETNAKDDQTGAEIKTAYEGEADTNAFIDAEKTKLGTVDTNADVTSDNPTGRCATFVVAANDSSALSKAQADYVCDGIDDDVEIQAALDALTSGRTGVEKVLCMGDFTLGNTLYIHDSFTSLDINGSFTASDTFGIWEARFNPQRLISIDADIVLVSISNGVLYGNKTGIAGSGGWCYHLTGLYITQRTTATDPFVDQRINIYDVHAFNFNNMGFDVRSRRSNFYRCTSNHNDTYGFNIGQTDQTFIDCYAQWNTLSGFNIDGQWNHFIKCISAFNTEHGFNITAQGGDSVFFGGYSEWNTLHGINIDAAAHYNYISAMKIIANSGDGVVLNSDWNIIIGNHIFGSAGEQDSAINFDAAAQHNNIAMNHFYDNVTTFSGTIDSSNIIRQNIGYTTETSGTATLLNTNTSVTVNHGLDTTPAAGDIMITPIEAWGAMTEFYIDTYTSTQFTIHSDQDPGQDVDFAWKAIVL